MEKFLCRLDWQSRMLCDPSFNHNEQAFSKIELHKTGLGYGKNLLKYHDWIDVKFLKPELGERVLCFEDLGNGNGVQYVARLEEGGWYKGNIYVEYPTHWMPLPNNP